MAKKMERLLVAIDPGITGTGFAVFSPLGQTLRFTHVFKPILDDAAPWFSRAADVAAQLAANVQEAEPCDIVIELPIVYQSSAGRNAQHSGSIIKLGFLTGMLYGMARTRMGVGEIRCVTAPEWKGQLPHAIVVKRVVRIYPQMSEKGVTEHEIDAVGLGIFHLRGEFK